MNDEAQAEKTGYELSERPSSRIWNPPDFWKVAQVSPGFFSFLSYDFEQKNLL